MVVVASIDPTRARTSAWPSPRGSIRPPGLHGHDRRVRCRPARLLREVADRVVAAGTGRDQLRPGPAAVQDRAGRFDDQPIGDPVRRRRDGCQPESHEVPDHQLGHAAGPAHDLLRIGATPTSLAGGRDRGLIIVISDREPARKSRGVHQQILAGTDQFRCTRPGRSTTGSGLFGVRKLASALSGDQSGSKLPHSIRARRRAHGLSRSVPESVGAPNPG